MPPAQGDAYATDVEEDECHKNDLLLNDIAGTLEVHNNDECEVASDVSAVQSKEIKPPSPKKRKNAEAVLWKKKGSLKEIPQVNVMYLADSHSHLALLEPIALFRLSFNEEIHSLIQWFSNCASRRPGASFQFSKLWFCAIKSRFYCVKRTLIVDSFLTFFSHFHNSVFNTLL